MIIERKISYMLYTLMIMNKSINVLMSCAQINKHKQYVLLFSIQINDQHKLSNNYKYSVRQCDYCLLIYQG